MILFHRVTAFEKAGVWLLLFSLCNLGVLFAQAEAEAGGQAQAVSPATSVQPSGTPNASAGFLTPTTFKPLKITAKDRNPFEVAKKGEKMEGKVVADANMVPKLFHGMRVSGISGSQGKYSIQLGPLRLREGDRVPQLFAGEDSELSVKTITAERVVFVYDIKEGETEARQFEVAIELTPRVRSLMLGEAMAQMGLVGTEMPALKSPGTDAFLQGAKEQEFQSFTERNVETLGIPGEKRRNEEDGQQDGF